MRSTLKDHIASLLKPFIDKLVAALGRLSRLPASRQEDSAFFVFDRHEVGGDFDVDNIGSVWMGAEVVHEEVVGVVDKEMQSVNHFSVVTYQGHFDGLFHDFDNGGFGFSFLLE